MNPNLSSRANISSNPSSETRGGYWFEILTSPGPRKDSNSYLGPVSRELGEDAAGLLQFPGETFFWLSDGTSEETIWPGFSARILAQDIGGIFTQTALQKIVFNHPNDPTNPAQSAPVDGDLIVPIAATPPVATNCLALVQATLENLRATWQGRVNERWQKLIDSGETENYLKRFSFCGDGSLQMIWSTTFMAGTLNHKNKTLAIMNLGDSGCLVQSTNQEAMPTIISKDRVFVRLETSPGNMQPPIVNVYPQPLDAGSVQIFENVEALLCVTDGNSTILLENLFRDFSKRGVAGLVELIKQLRQSTYDDRTFIHGRRFGK